MSKASSANESGAQDRRIDSSRVRRALTDDMAVTPHAPGQFVVRRADHDDHLVDIEAGACDCKDSFHRNVVCIHLVRASLHHAFTSAPNTRLVARVLRAVREAGCVHGTTGCNGPTAANDRGTIPCPDCAAATSTGIWTVWCRVTGNDDRLDVGVDRGAGVVTDGGQPDEPDEDDSHRAESVCMDCGGSFPVGGSCDCGGVERL